MTIIILPCNLTKEAGISLGDMFLNHVIPVFFNGDRDGVLERARLITSEGKLNRHFRYLQDYVEGVLI
jgi:hypothetical protein